MIPVCRVVAGPVKDQPLQKHGHPTVLTSKLDVLAILHFIIHSNDVIHFLINISLWCWEYQNPIPNKCIVTVLIYEDMTIDVT